MLRVHVAYTVFLFLLEVESSYSNLFLRIWLCIFQYSFQGFLHEQFFPAHKMYIYFESSSAVTTVTTWTIGLVNLVRIASYFEKFVRICQNLAMPTLIPTIRMAFFCWSHLYVFAFYWHTVLVVQLLYFNLPFMKCCQH